MNWLRRLTAIPVALGALLSACGLLGGQTGEGSESGPSCVDQPPQAIALDAESALGFRAADVLAFAEGSHAIEGAWPAAETATGTLTITRRAEQARFVDAAIDRPLPEDPCRGHLEIDVRAALSIENAKGPLAAEFDAVLLADTSEVARLSLRVDPGVFIGDLQLSPQQDESLREAWLRASVSPVATSGLLEAVFERTVQPAGEPSEPRGDAPRAGPYIVERVANMLEWPAGTPCAPAELSLPLSATLFSVTPSELVTALPADLPISWQSGGSTTLHLVAAPESQWACLSESCTDWCLPVDYPPVPFEDRGMLGVPIVLSVSAEDGRWVGDISVWLQLEVAKETGLLRASIGHYARYGSTADLLAAEGFSAPSGSSGDLHFSVSLLFEPATDGRLTASGTVNVDVLDTVCRSGQMCTGGPGLRALEAGTISPP